METHQEYKKKSKGGVLPFGKYISPPPALPLRLESLQNAQGSFQSGLPPQCKTSSTTTGFAYCYNYTT